VPVDHFDGDVRWHLVTNDDYRDSLLTLEPMT
jgi:hypothetical protein